MPAHSALGPAPPDAAPRPGSEAPGAARRPPGAEAISPPGPQTGVPAARPAQRIAMLSLGYGCLGLAALGAVLPLMPTTVFLIAAAWAFGRASPALRARLLADPRFGATLRAWQQHGSISIRAKRLALLAMAVGWAVTTLILRDPMVAAISGLCLGAVALWLVTRPTAPPPPGPGTA